MTLQSESNRQLIQQRLNLFYIPIVLIFLILAARLWQLQIIRGSGYAKMAENNRIRTIQVVAPRGTILDRNNIPLVDNRPSFNVLLYRESMEDQAATSRFITEKLGVNAEDLATQLQRSKRSGFYLPVVIKEGAGIEAMSIIEAHRREHPEIQLGPEPRRNYLFGKLAAHVLGYVGEVSEDELTEKIFPEAQAGSLVGKSGVERIYNENLVGKDGSRQVVVDSVGREIGTLAEINAGIGGELQLTLDLELQSVAENLLEEKVGAIVAMDPRNGEILAMASAPSFDPNSFSAHISEKDWNKLVNDPDHPLQNRAIQNSYSPGSVFKLIMASAGLEEGVIQASTRLFCRGKAVFYGRTFHCHKAEGHGSLDLEQAIAKSCNVYFYELGKRLGISKIAEHAQAFGFGHKTGIDLPGERKGVMPSPEWKEDVYGTQWYSGETISVSIGQGAVNTTPLQIIRAISAIATGGRLTTPHLLLRAENVSGSPVYWPVIQLTLGEENAVSIRQGMWESANNYGTSHNAAIPGLDICGKTGTAQIISKENKRTIEEDAPGLEDHAWFVGFASKDDPEIAVVVFIEHGGKGGGAAAPLAREIFNTYFSKKGQSHLISELRGSVPVSGN